MRPSIQLYHCICTLSHTPQSRLGPVSHLDQNGPLTWSPREIGTAGATASKGRRPARVPRTSTATAAWTASSCRTSSPCPAIFGLPHSSALVSTRILLLLRNRTGSVSRCNRCGDVNFAWEHEPEPSSRETTTSLSRTCARRVFVKMTAHRRLRNDRCTCPYLFENYSNLLYYTIERVGVY